MGKGNQFRNLTTPLPEPGSLSARVPARGRFADIKRSNLQGCFADIKRWSPQVCFAGNAPRSGNLPPPLVNYIVGSKNHISCPRTTLWVRRTIFRSVNHIVGSKNHIMVHGTERWFFEPTIWFMGPKDGSLNQQHGSRDRKMVL